MQAEAASWSATLVQLTVEKTILEYLLDFKAENQIWFYWLQVTFLKWLITLYFEKISFAGFIPFELPVIMIYFFKWKRKNISGYSILIAYIILFPGFITSLSYTYYIFKLKTKRWNLFKQFLFIEKVICAEFRSELSMVTFMLIWSISFLPLVLGKDDHPTEGLLVKVIKESTDRTNVENPNGK